MEKREKNRYVSAGTIVAFLLCALMLIIFATKGVQNLLFDGSENRAVRMILDVVIYAVPTAALIYLGDKANKWDKIRRQQRLDNKARKE